MRRPKPRIARRDEVSITRQDDTAIIAFHDGVTPITNLVVGKKIRRLSDDGILELYIGHKKTAEKLGTIADASQSNSTKLRKGATLLIKCLLVLGMTFACAMGVFAATMTTPDVVQATIIAQGSFDHEADSALENAVPHVIADKATFEKLWTTWKVAGPAPTVDFSKQMVIACTTVGSVINPSFTLKPDGNLLDTSMATMDFRPGFRYKICLINREGVLKVNGKPLPAAPVLAAPTAGIVLDGPKPETTLSNPITLSGKAVGIFEGTVTIEILNANGIVIARTFTTAAGDTGAFRCRAYYNQPLPEPVKSKIVVYSEIITEDGKRQELFRTEIPVMLTSTREIDGNDKKVQP